MRFVVRVVTVTVLFGLRFPFLLLFLHSTLRLSSLTLSCFVFSAEVLSRRGSWSIVEMGASQTTKIALAVAFFGILSFIFGVIAENKKPAFGTPIHGKGVIICKFPNDPTIALGSLSVVTLFLAALAGHVAVYFPYKGKTVPVQALSRSVSLVIFFIIAEVVSGVALGMMLWATIAEGLHRSRNVHYNIDTECSTAKTGLFGGAAFLALDCSLIWLVCQILTLNARADYLEEDDSKGEYGQVYAT